MPGAKNAARFRTASRRSAESALHIQQGNTVASAFERTDHQVSRMISKIVLFDAFGNGLFTYREPCQGPEKKMKIGGREALVL